MDKKDDRVLGMKLVRDDMTAEVSASEVFFCSLWSGGRARFNSKLPTKVERRTL